MHEETFVSLLGVFATGGAITVRRLRVPYTVALVLTGLVLGALHVLEAPHLTRELLFAVFLPGLLFDAAFHLDFQDFWNDRLPIFSLAIPGVVVAIAITAAILAPVLGVLGIARDFTWQQALVFGALIAATDPIAVIGLFRTMGVPRRLAVLLEGESLLNDGTSIVLFGLALGLTSGDPLRVGALTVDFVRIVGMGALIGAAIGLAISSVVRSVTDPMIEITLTTIAAYGAFVTAEQFHDSGVIATVVAGMLCGNYAARTGMSPSTRIAVETFWEYVAFALNSIVFLLIGFELDPWALVHSWPIIVVAYLSVTLGRAGVILGVTGLLGARGRSLPRTWGTVLTWGGLRGALSMVLVLALPRDFPHRELIVSMTFGVVLLSILIQGLSMSWLLHRLGVVRRNEDRAIYELARGSLQGAHAALDELERMARQELVHADVLAGLRQDYEARIASDLAKARKVRLEQEHIREEELRRARRHLLLVEKNHAIEANRQGNMRREIYDELLADIDARLWLLESGEDRDDGEPADADRDGDKRRTPPT
jgi:CPA1 family monovalent cation:H+ antiporter